MKFLFLSIFILCLTSGCATHQLKPQHSDICEQRAALNESLELTQKDLQKYFPQFNETININHDYMICGKDKTKPPVILLHELLGVETKTLNYAKTLAEDFTVYLPVLFGKVYRDTYNSIAGYNGYHFSDKWKQKESLNGSTLTIEWLKKFTTFVEKNHPNSEIGVIGMCFTGELPLALLSNPKVTRIVLAQPALPFGFKSAIDTEKRVISMADWENAVGRIKDKKTAKAYGTRFELDEKKSSKKKYEYLAKELGDGFCDRRISCKEYKIFKNEQNSDDPADCDAYLNQKDTDKLLFKIDNDAHSTLVHDWVDHLKHPTEIRRREIKIFLKSTNYLKQ